MTRFIFALYINSWAKVFPMAYWGFRVGPIGFGGRVRGPDPETLLLLVLGGIVAGVFMGILTPLVSLYFFIFTVNGRDETYFLLIFFIVFWLLLSVVSTLMPEQSENKPNQSGIFNFFGSLIISSSSAGVFALFWKQVPLVDPDLARLPVPLEGVTLLAPLKMWLAALGGASACFLATLFLHVKMMVATERKRAIYYSKKIRKREQAEEEKIRKRGQAEEEKIRKREQAEQGRLREFQEAHRKRELFSLEDENRLLMQKYSELMTRDGLTTVADLHARLGQSLKKEPEENLNRDSLTTVTYSRERAMKNKKLCETALKELSNLVDEITNSDDGSKINESNIRESFDAVRHTLKSYSLLSKTDVKQYEEIFSRLATEVSVKLGYLYL